MSISFFFLSIISPSCHTSATLSTASHNFRSSLHLLYSSIFPFPSYPTALCQSVSSFYNFSLLAYQRHPLHDVSKFQVFSPFSLLYISFSFLHICIFNSCHPVSSSPFMLFFSFWRNRVTHLHTICSILLRLTLPRQYVLMYPFLPSFPSHTYAFCHLVFPFRCFSILLYPRQRHEGVFYCHSVHLSTVSTPPTFMHLLSPCLPFFFFSSSFVLPYPRHLSLRHLELSVCLSLAFALFLFVPYTYMLLDKLFLLSFPSYLSQHSASLTASSSFFPSSPFCLTFFSTHVPTH